MAAVPADGIQQGDGILGVVGHRVVGLGLRGLTQPALVVGQDVEVLRNRPVEDAGLAAQVAASAADVEQAWPAALALVVQPQVANVDERHDRASPSEQ